MQFWHGTQHKQQEAAARVLRIQWCGHAGLSAVALRFAKVRYT
jgi:hypothetical protein